MGAIELIGSGPQIRYSITRDELLSACTESLLQSRLFQRKVVVCQATALGILSIGAVVTLFKTYPLGILAMGIVALFWTVLAAGFVALMRFTMRRGVTKNYRDWTNQGLFDGQAGTHRMVLTEQGIVEDNDRGVVLIRWPYVTGLESTARYLRLLSGPVQFFLVPKSAFTDDHAAEAFEAAARQKMQDSKENPYQAGDGKP